MEFKTCKNLVEMAIAMTFAIILFVSILFVVCHEPYNGVNLLALVVAGGVMYLIAQLLKNRLLNLKFVDDIIAFWRL